MLSVAPLYAVQNDFDSLAAGAGVGWALEVRAARQAGQRVPTEQRRLLVVQLVDKQEFVSADALATRFDVSHMTIYRDLKALDAQGALRFTRGGALKVTPSPLVEARFTSKRTVNRTQKERIARYAAHSFVGDGDILILEGGTTVASMVRHLDASKLTVVTNGLDTTSEAFPLLSKLSVMCCGGLLRDTSATFVGPQAEAFFRDLRADTLFLSATGLIVPDGLYDPNLLEIQVKRSMVQSAARVVVLIDSSKFGQRSLAQVVSLEQIDVLVTDEGVKDEDVERMRALGIDVHVVVQ